MLEAIMGAQKIIAPQTEEVLSFMLDMVTQVSAYRNHKDAIGYSFLFYTTEMVQAKKIKLLAINGVYPSQETIRAGTYPYADEFYAITTATQNENVPALIEWILSAQGQALIKATGYVPVAEM